jgi:hypothetical protein
MRNSKKLTMIIKREARGSKIEKIEQLDNDAQKYSNIGKRNGFDCYEYWADGYLYEYDGKTKSYCRSTMSYEFIKNDRMEVWQIDYQDNSVSASKGKIVISSLTSSDYTFKYEITLTEDKKYKSWHFADTDPEEINVAYYYEADPKVPEGFNENQFTEGQCH